MKQKEKDDLLLLSIINGCTLDCEPATLKGRLLDHPLICSDKMSVEFSWQAASRILNSNRCFKS